MAIDNGEIENVTPELLIEKAERVYSFEEGANSKQLRRKIDVQQERYKKSADQTYDEKYDLNTKEGLCKYLDEAPTLLVYEYFNGVKPSEETRRRFDVYAERGYKLGVINALIYYISIDPELSYNSNLMDSIISGWTNQKVVSAESALEVGFSQRKLIKKQYVPKVSREQITVDPSAINPKYIDYELSTPFDFLKKMVKGKMPFKRHIELAERLVLQYGISIGVTNVIIEKAWKMSKGTLPENLVERLAAEYREKEFSTAEEAYIYSTSIKQFIQPRIVTVPPLNEESVSPYDELTPYEFLKKLYKGKEPVKYLIDMAENFVIYQGMPIGVVNVLMEYAFKENALNKNFIEAVAANWLKENVLNVKDTFELIEQQKNPITQTGVSLDYIQKFRVNQTDLSKWMEAYDGITPLEFMRNLLKSEPVTYFVKIADELVIQNNVPVGVVNVILEYVLTSNSKRFSKNTIQTIAANMQLQKIEFAQDAIEYIQRYYVNKQVQLKVTKDNLHQFYPKEYVFNDVYQKYENNTPYEFIKLLNDGVEPFPYSVQAAETLILNRNMTPSVVNFLFEYISENTNGALVESYIYTVADSWARNRVKTIDEAKEVISQREKNRKSKGKKKVGVVPDWFKKKEDKISSTTETSEKESKVDEDLELRKRKILERFKKE